MRSSDDANVDLDRSRTPDSFEFPLLQDPQQCDLRVGRKVTDFIQEDGAAIRQFKAPEAPLHRSGEGPLLMAEQFRGDQSRRQCKDRVVRERRHPLHTTIANKADQRQRHEQDDGHGAGQPVTIHRPPYAGEGVGRLHDTVRRAGAVRSRRFLLTAQKLRNI